VVTFGTKKYPTKREKCKKKQKKKKKKKKKKVRGKVLVVAGDRRKTKQRNHPRYKKKYSK